MAAEGSLRLRFFLLEINNIQESAPKKKSLFTNVSKYVTLPMLAAWYERAGFILMSNPKHVTALCWI